MKMITRLKIRTFISLTVFLLLMLMLTVNSCSQPQPVINKHMKYRFYKTDVPAEIGVEILVKVENAEAAFLLYSCYDGKTSTKFEYVGGGKPDDGGFVNDFIATTCYDKLLVTMKAFSNIKNPENAQKAVMFWVIDMPSKENPVYRM